MIGGLAEREAAAVEEIRRWRDGLTLAEVAEREGLSRERVRQIQVAAIRKLRNFVECSAQNNINGALERARQKD